MDGPFDRSRVLTEAVGDYENAPLQRVGVFVEIPRLLREMNVEPEPFLTRLGVDPALLSDIESRLPFPVVSELMLKCAEATARDDFSLVLGASARLRHLGIIGALLSAAANLGAALLDFVANHPVMCAARAPI